MANKKKNIFCTVGLLAVACALLFSGCGEGEKLPEGVVATFERGEVTAAELTNYEHGRPAEIPPGFRLDLLIVEARERGWIPEAPALCLLAFYHEQELACGLQYSEESLAMPLTDEEIAGRIALEKILSRQPLPFESGQELENWQDLEETIQQVFQAVEFGYSRMNILSVSEELIRQEYEKQKDAYRLPARIDFRHLFLSNALYPDETENPEEATLKRMEEIRLQLRSGLPFGRLIDQWSDSESHSRGGWVLKAEPELLREDIQKPLAGLAPGEFSNPIETPEGMHLLQLIQRHKPRSVPLEEVREEIVLDLLEEKQEEIYQQIVQKSSLKIETQNIDQPDRVQLKVGRVVYPATETARLLAYFQDDEDSLKQLGRALAYLQSLKDQPVETFAPVERSFLSAYRTEIFVASKAKKLLERMKVGPAELRQFYQEHRHLFYQPWAVRLETALVPWPEHPEGDSAEEYLNRQKRREQVYDWIEKLQENPGAKADDYGWNSSRWQKGEKVREIEFFDPATQQVLLGALSREEVAQSDNRVVVPEPVETEEGLLVIRLLERQPARFQDFEEVEEEIKGAWREEKMKTALKTVRRKILAESGFQLEREMVE